MEAGRVSMNKAGANANAASASANAMRCLRDADHAFMLGFFLSARSLCSPIVSSAQTSPQLDSTLHHRLSTSQPHRRRRMRNRHRACGCCARMHVEERIRGVVRNATTEPLQLHRHRHRHRHPDSTRLDDPSRLSVKVEDRLATLQPRLQ